MKHLPWVLLIALFSIACGVRAHDGVVIAAHSTAASASTPTPGPRPTSTAQLCEQLPWPRPVPPIVGVVIGDAMALLCWDDVRAVAPDGHDPQNNPNDGDKGM
jgi:hypothetical protein